MLSEQVSTSCLSISPSICLLVAISFGLLFLTFQGSFDDEGDDDDEEKSEKENKRTFKEKLQAVQVRCYRVFRLK